MYKHDDDDDDDDNGVFLRLEIIVWTRSSFSTSQKRFEFLTTTGTSNVVVWNGKMFTCLRRKVQVPLQR